LAIPPPPPPPPPLPPLPPLPPPFGLIFNIKDLHKLPSDTIHSDSRLN